jgi:hypothetical protein
MPKSLMLSRLAIMLMPYLVLYRLSKWVSLAQGKLLQIKQYFSSVPKFQSQFLIKHEIRVFGLRLSSPRQPGHGFFSLPKARQRLQFIPQGATSVADIVFFFFEPTDINPCTSPELILVPSLFKKPTTLLWGARLSARPYQQLVSS